MPNCGVDSGLPRSRHASMQVEEAFGPSASFVVTVPVEPSNKSKPLRRCKSQAMNIRDKNQKGHECLTRAGKSKFVRLFRGIYHVAAKISQCDNLRSGSLSLEQIRTEVRVIERMAYGP